MAEALKISCRRCHSKLDLSDCEPFSKIACPECGTTLTVPMRFERYLLEKVCGKGGDAVVYRAIEPELARRVAVKLSAHENDDETTQRFINSARMSGKLAHAAVVPVYNCGTFEGRSFLVMRLMENGDLEQMMKQGKLPDMYTLLSWFAALIPGLIEARNENIVHHDIKPANIMLTADNEPKLGDWDIADIREPGDRQTPCSLWASPIYTSPERIFGGGEDYKGDIFSLGVTIYELLTGGSAPFGLHGEPAVIYERRQKMEFQSLHALVPGIPPALSMVVTGMLDFYPEYRPDYEEILTVFNSLIANNQ